MVPSSMSNKTLLEEYFKLRALRNYHEAAESPQYSREKAEREECHAKMQLVYKELKKRGQI